MSKRPKAPEGWPDELKFCKRTFPFYRTDNAGRQLYRLDHVLLIVVPGTQPGTYTAAICPTSKDRSEEYPLANGTGESPQAAAKRTEKSFQSIFYKIKPLMER